MQSLDADEVAKFNIVNRPVNIAGGSGSTRWFCAVRGLADDARKGTAGLGPTRRPQSMPGISGDCRTEALCMRTDNAVNQWIKCADSSDAFGLDTNHLLPYLRSEEVSHAEASQFAGLSNLRALDINGEPWFVAKDVCDVLGINTNNLRRDLDETDIKPLQLSGSAGRPPLIINESGLYTLILKSRKPEAKAFQRWVTAEVLPSLRKHGIAMTPKVAAAVATGLL